ncbi:hypothetical protein AAKU55_002808 [Oxalobacteraceae bacterium GrIS 1.11]
MIYELRIYHCVPGRMPALHDRFETSTLAIWEKHGIRPMGFWTTLVGPNNQTLSYMLQWDSLGEREIRWNAFLTDPVWIAIRAATEADGLIVERIDNQILAPTAYSPMQ